MDYTKQLIDKARGCRCKICQEYITEDEAAACEFQANKTTRGSFAFVYNKCLKGEREVRKV